MPSTPFWPEWSDPFHSGRNGMVNPLHRRKKYAFRLAPQLPSTIFLTLEVRVEQTLMIKRIQITMFTEIPYVHLL